MSTRPRGLVGPMLLHRAACNGDLERIRKLVQEEGHDPNEVEAAGNTPLHSAAYEGNLEVAKLLVELGANVNASNNGGDRPWHWAWNLDDEAMMKFLEDNGSEKEKALPLVPDHVPKVDDFFEKRPDHPKISEEYLREKAEEDAELKKITDLCPTDLKPGEWEE